jgi:hypothetical protein
VLKQHGAEAAAVDAGATAAAVDAGATAATAAPVPPADPPVQQTDAAGAVVLDYCAAVRGILNDDQGGPLHPPGLRMAEALAEVRDSIQRNLDEKKGGSRRSNSAAWPAVSTAASTPSAPPKTRSAATSRTSRKSRRRLSPAAAVAPSAGRSSRN